MFHGVPNVTFISRSIVRLTFLYFLVHSHYEYGICALAYFLYVEREESVCKEEPATQNK